MAEHASEPSAQDILAEMEAPAEDATQESQESPDGQDGGEEKGEKESAAPEKSEKDGEVEAKEPLPPDELEKRWKDQQGATFAERQRRKEAERRAEETQDKLIRMMERMQGGQQQEQQPQGIPDPEDDPIAALKAMKQQAEIQEQQRREYAQRQAQAQQIEEQVQRLARDVTEIEQDFARSQPDYYEAVNHLVDVRTQQLQSFGITNPNQVRQQIKGEIAQLSDNALRSGANPAEAAYQMAKQMGYAQKRPDPKENLDNVRRGLKAAKTISGGGKGSGGQPTLAEIAELDGKAFDDACDRLFANE